MLSFVPMHAVTSTPCQIIMTRFGIHVGLQYLFGVKNVHINWKKL